MSDLTVIVTDEPPITVQVREAAGPAGPPGPAGSISDPADFAYMVVTTPRTLATEGEWVELTWDEIPETLGASFEALDAGDGTFVVRFTQPGWYLLSGNAQFAAANGDDVQVGGIRHVSIASKFAYGLNTASVLPSGVQPFLSALTSTYVDQAWLATADPDNPLTGPRVRLETMQVSGGPLDLLSAELCARRLS